MHTERETPDQSCHPATDRPAPRSRDTSRAGLSVSQRPRSDRKYAISEISGCGREHLWCIDIIDYHNYVAGGVPWGVAAGVFCRSYGFAASARPLDRARGARPSTRAPAGVDRSTMRGASRATAPARRPRRRAPAAARTRRHARRGFRWRHCRHLRNVPRSAARVSKSCDTKARG